MNLCDCAPQSLAQLRVLIAKCLHLIYEQQYQTEPPRRATRVRDLTFLPHLLGIGKPLRHITVQDIASTIPNCNLPNCAPLLQQQIEQLSQADWYYQSETEVLKRLASGPREPTEGGETPAGGSPPGVGQHHAPNAHVNQQPDPPGGKPPSGGPPPGEVACSDAGEPHEVNRGRLPAGGRPPDAETRKRVGYPLVVPPKRSQNTPGEGGCPLAAHLD